MGGQILSSPIEMAGHPYNSAASASDSATGWHCAL